MQAKEFKKNWNDIKEKKVNVAYGKQIFRNLVLVGYNETAGTVNTEFKGLLSIRAIKSIDLVQEHVFEPEPGIIEFFKYDIQRKGEQFEEPEVEVVQVTPRLPDNWNENGYFIIISQGFGNAWKRAELRGSNGEVVLMEGKEMKSDTSFRVKGCLHWVYEVKNRLREKVSNYLIDDTFIVPQYFDISEPVIKQLK